MADYPKWIKITTKEFGDIDIIVNDVAEEKAAKKATATFTLTKSAQGDHYKLVR